MASPDIGSYIQIHSFKHDGHLHRVWDQSLVLKGTDSVVILANDKTKVTESDGRSWITREPAICYFDATNWFNIICMIRNDGVHYYCNISSPSIYDGEALKYIDYDLDVKVFPDMTLKILDEDEYVEHSRQMHYPEVIDHILHRNLDDLLGWIRQRKGPFAAGFVDKWYERYLTYR